MGTNISAHCLRALKAIIWINLGRATGSQRVDRIFQNQNTLAYYQGLGLASHLDSLASYLSGQGYGRRSVRGTLICLRMVAEFLAEKRLELGALESPATIVDFRDYWRQRSVAVYGRKPGEAAFNVYQRAIDHLF